MTATASGGTCQRGVGAVPASDQIGHIGARLFSARAVMQRAETRGRE
ncbi:MAG: hypothetical protein ACOYXR_02300 [Nitrospirota bacterium]